MKCPDRSPDARRTVHSAVSTTLALYSDRALRELVDVAAPLGSGIGGKSALLEVAGTPVFVKRVPLTDLERRPDGVRSTANLFELPAFCQYGIGTIGTPGFGAWRELAVHTMTTNWVLAGQYEGFPLMYHWRVLPDSTPLPEELADVDRAVAYWGGGAQVRRRIEALQQSSASVALFLEYIPQNLHQWLGERMDAGGEAADRACAMVERELEAGTSFMNSRGLLHFDVHFENILTDGRRLFFADYGLAVSSRFELSPEEAGFFDRHRTYDRCYSASYLVNWLVTALYGYRRDDREAQVRAYAQGERPTGIPEEAAEILARHAPLTAVMADFFRTFERESRETPYPLEEIRRMGCMYGASFD
ncbi:protein kinase family protein [Streptomyces hirsutus]|uniref:Protein kinase family protein n=1 Tax=Streptomyces hirsutus TaxID=35620 RepID=A0ABZ1GYT9_9ACTN|nr:protein kinase family protein [Streptomyces hirsutus]WSD11386.1 protein kinase family protein [Streptomyces hirsutus]